MPFRFQGQQEDSETGLFYNRFRYYDPTSAGYLSSDSIGIMGGLRLNGYVDDAVTLIDPFGLASRDNPNHVVYQGFKLKDGKVLPYIGRASGPAGMSALELIKRRYSGNYDGFVGGIMPKALHENLNYDQARGLEDHEFKKRGGKDGTSNRSNPVGERNKNKNTYHKAASDYLDKEAKINKNKSQFKG